MPRIFVKEPWMAGPTVLLLLIPLWGFEGFLNASAPFLPQEHKVLYKTKREYDDFKFENNYKADCTHLRFGTLWPSSCQGTMQELSRRRKLATPWISSSSFLETWTVTLSRRISSSILPRQRILRPRLTLQALFAEIWRTPTQPSLSPRYPLNGAGGRDESTFLPAFMPPQSIPLTTNISPTVTVMRCVKTPL